ncbi:hypothetical protein PENSPDRAFT_334075 [Peniophora sp. CONT]|nr:hypothetical protein PENSPDRAFT_334075 [Peniophora sp. CONT]
MRDADHAVQLTGHDILMNVRLCSFLLTAPTSKRDIQCLAEAEGASDAAPTPRVWHTLLARGIAGDSSSGGHHGYLQLLFRRHGNMRPPIPCSPDMHGLVYERCGWDLTQTDGDARLCNSSLGHHDATRPPSRLRLYPPGPIASSHVRLIFRTRRNSCTYCTCGSLTTNPSDGTVPDIISAALDEYSAVPRRRSRQYHAPHMVLPLEFALVFVSWIDAIYTRPPPKR